MSAPYAFFAVAVGGMLGSFLNVVVYRLPRGESLLAPGSHCPTCHAPVKPHDNVPLLSWVWLRGRCRACSTSISARYPLVEALTAALVGAVVLERSSIAAITLGVVLVLTLVPVALIDLEYHVIPNRITLTAAAALLVLGSALDPSGEPERLLAGAGGAGFLLLAHLARPAGMGMGDVKLAGVIGLALGRDVAPAVLLALLGGILIGLVLMLRAPAGERRSTGLPFGPALALGGVVALFAGPALISAYVHHLI